MASLTYIAAFCCGISSHVNLFSKGEWDRKAPKIVLVHSLLSVVIFTAFALVAKHPFAICILETFKVSFSFTSGFSASLLAYRLLFHPLKSFPGPPAARISSLWAFWKQWPNLDLYIRLQDIHNEYGDFVRISEVTDVDGKTPANSR